MEAAALIMTWIFAFGDSFSTTPWHSYENSSNSNMGYYSYLSSDTKNMYLLILTSGRMIPLLLIFRDDLFGVVIIWDIHKWIGLEIDLNNFGILKWKWEKPCQCLSFLDLTLILKDGNISNNNYQNSTSLWVPIHLSKFSLSSMGDKITNI